MARNNNRKPTNGGKPGNRKPWNKKDNEDKLKSKTNEPSWYAADPSLIRDIASFPFSRPSGTPVGYQYPNVSTLNDETLYTDFYKSSVPGILRAELLGVCGTSQDATSAVNVAAQSLYSFVVHANSRNTRYEKADLMIYMLANSQIYGYINYLQRVYGTALLWSQRNRLLPRYLLESDGIDYDDIIKNLANFRYGINLLVNKASSFAVPATFTLFNRHAFLYQNYYIEGESIKEQIYYFAPRYFFKFALDEDSSGMLTPLQGVDIGTEDEFYFNTRLSPQPGMKMTTARLLRYGNELVDAMLEQEDFGIISGDILKCYGQNIIKLASLDEYYAVNIVEDDKVLLQFKNMTTVESFNGASYTNVNIYQRNGLVLYEPVIRFTGSTAEKYSQVAVEVMGSDQAITSNHNDVSNEEIIESTRLMAALGPNKINPTYPIIICGSEIPLEVTTFWITSDGTNQSATLNNMRMLTLNFLTTGSPHWRYICAIAAHGSSFRFHPRILPLRVETGSDPMTWWSTGFIWDYDNYTLISRDELQRMHDACLFNMLHVPAVASANNK